MKYVTRSECIDKFLVLNIRSSLPYLFKKVKTLEKESIVKKLPIVKVPRVLCPINQKHYPKEHCKQCDAYKGSDKDIVKCAADEL
jgi:hypothetical protein